MIIDCVSDLHGEYPNLEGGDMLIVAGDLTGRHHYEEYVKFGLWISDQNYRKKVVIGGNHDGVLQDIPFIFSGIPDLVFTYLCDFGTEFEGLKIWGSPWTKTFPRMNPECKAFTVDTEEELAEKWSLIPEDIDILVTHSAPYLIGDRVERYRAPAEHVGSKSLGDKVDNSRIKLHVFGHIHSGHGITQKRREKDAHEFIFVNASIMDEDYDPTNDPIRVVL